MTNTIKEAVNKIALAVGTIQTVGYSKEMEYIFEKNLEVIMNEQGLDRDEATDYAIQIAARLNEEKVTA